MAKKYTPKEFLDYLKERHGQKTIKDRKADFTLQDAYQYIYREKMPNNLGGYALKIVKVGSALLVQINEDKIVKETRGRKKTTRSIRRKSTKQNESE